MIFGCSVGEGQLTERWDGVILRLTDFGSHYEMRIQSRSGITVIFGKSSYGYFACIPDFDAGCHLGSLKDKRWNTERLVNALGEIDGITVACALHAISDKIRNGGNINGTKTVPKERKCYNHKESNNCKDACEPAH